MLTCYSPVRHSLFISIATEWSAFDLHVLGTPPAFVLSQDQTLHRDSRPTRYPEGSLTGQESESRQVLTRTIGNHRHVHLQRRIQSLCVLRFTKLTYNPSTSGETGADELPALAFGSHYSVFKERPGTHHYCRCWCRVFRRTAPDGLLRRRVSFGCRTDLGGLSGG